MVVFFLRRAVSSEVYEKPCRNILSLLISSREQATNEYIYRAPMKFSKIHVEF